MCKYGKELYKTGMNEYLSPPYHSYNSAPWLNIVEYSQSAEARLMARAILDWMLADYALNYHHGILLPLVQRAAGMLTTNVYTDKNGKNRPANRYQKSHAHTASQWTGWLYWGGSNTPEDQTAIETDPIFKIYRDLGTPAFWQSISDCVPHRVIRNIGAKRVDTPYTIWQTRGNRRQNIETQKNKFEDLGKKIAAETPLSRQQMRSVYVSRNYALGAGYRRKDIRDPYNRMAFPFAVVWKSSNPLNWLTVAHPYWNTARPLDKNPASEENTPDTVGSFDWAGVSPFGQMIHWENCTVLLYDIPTNDPYPDDNISQRTATLIQSIYVYFPETLGEPVKRSEWWFFSEGDVYIGIRPFPGHASKETDGHTGFNRLAVDGSLVGVVVEVGDEREYGSFAKFQKTIITRTRLDLACLESERRVRYVSTRRHTLDLKHRASDWLPEAYVNCARLDFDRWPRSLSPYVTCENCILDVNDGQEGFTINWQDDLPVYEYYDLVNGQKVHKPPPQSSCW